MNKLNPSKCPICGKDLKTKTIISFPDPTTVYCKNCGTFTISNRAFKILPDEEKENAIISHNIRIRENTYKIIGPNDIREYLEKELPSPSEQSESLINFLGNNLNSIGDQIDILAKDYQALIGSLNEFGFYSILEHLNDDGIIEGGAKIVRGGGGAYEISIKGPCSLTMDGWELFNSLKNKIHDEEEISVTSQLIPNDIIEGIEKFRKDHPIDQKTAISGFPKRLISCHAPVFDS